MSRRPTFHVRLIGLASLIAVGVGLAVVFPALADYLGPNRTITTWEWRRLHCSYQAVYDPPGPGWYGCYLNLYEPPDSSCPSTGSVVGYFDPTACGWSQPYCSLYGCSISRSSSVEGCSEGESGCRAVERQTTLPEASVSGSIACGSPGSNGWCRGGGALDLSGSEPVSGHSILALEGTHNGAPFACSGASCAVGLPEGQNDFTFWAISSFGDTSRMGSASGRVDSQPPAVSGSAAGTPGDNGWYVSDVTVTASAADASPGSGLASFDIQVDGGGWTAYTAPVILGDGSHLVDLRALDGAGNAATESVSVAIDSAAPVASLSASASFCPGCGETGDVAISVDDTGSGVAAWALSADGLAVASGSGATSETIVWNGSGLSGGDHALTLDARDQAGNTGQASVTVSLMVPTAEPRSPPPTSPPESGGPPPAQRVPTVTVASTSAVVPTSTGSLPRPTATSRAITFGALPAAPATGDPGEGAGAETAPTLPAPGSSPNVLYGAAALAVIAGATAIALENQRRRREEEARLREEMARRNAEAEAREEAERQRLAQLAAEEQRLAALAAATAAAAAEADLRRGEVERRRLERKEEMLEPALQPAASPGAESQGSPAQAGAASTPGGPAEQGSGELSWWERLTCALRDGMEAVVRHPPAWLGISHQVGTSRFSLGDFVVDEMVTYQPSARNLWETLVYQQATLRADTSVRISSNPSARLDVNFANGRITLRGSPREDGSRVDWFLQPGSLSFGNVTLTRPDTTVQGRIVRGISATTYDVDIFGRNFLSARVSQAAGTSSSVRLAVADGEFETVTTNLVEGSMNVHRYPRIAVAVVACVEFGTAALAALGPLLQAPQPGGLPAIP